MRDRLFIARVFCLPKQFISFHKLHTKMRIVCPMCILSIILYAYQVSLYIVYFGVVCAQCSLFIRCLCECVCSFVRSFVYCLNILNMPARLNYTPFISFHPNAFYVFLLKYVHKIARVAARTHNRNTVNPAEPTPVFPNVKFKRFNRME